MKEIIWEAAKEPLRIFVLAVLPGLAAYFEVIGTEWAIVITILLRFIDKYMHLVGKADPDGKGSILEKGLTRF
jgi:hypothetical protein